MADIVDIPRKVRFIAIDPGSRTLGLAVLEYNFDDNTLTVLFTRCLNVDEGMTHLQYMTDLVGTRRARLYLIHRFLTEQIREWCPGFVIMETPYMGSFAQVFKVLVEIEKTIEAIITDFGNGISLFKIDPSTVKKTIGVSGKSGDKSLILAAVKALSNLVLKAGIVLDEITEHEVDAIAVGHYICVAEMKDEVLPHV